MKSKWLVIIALLVISTGSLISCNADKEPAGNGQIDDTSANSTQESNGTDSKQPSNGSDSCKEIVWISDWNKAISTAQNENKPILINFYTDVCPACRALEKNTFSDEEVISSLCKNFVTVKSNAGKSGLHANYGISGVPTTIFAWSDGEEMGRIIGAYPPESFLDGISQALEYWNQHKG